MPFKKGTSGNPAGRPKKITDHEIYKIRKAFLTLLENTFNQLERDIEAMSHKERLELVMHCSEFIVPKLSRHKTPEETEKPKSFLRKWVITPVAPPQEE